MRIIAIVVLSDGNQITIVTDENETVEAHLDRKGKDWYKYLII
jgi:hypothetical protein